MIKNNLLHYFQKFIIIIIISNLIFIAPLCIAQERNDSSSQIQENSRDHMVRVGLYENKPKIFTNEQGQPSGIFVNILEAIAHQEEWQISYVPMQWSEGLAALEQGQIDLMPDVAYSAQREKKFDFNEEEVLESWSQVYTNNKVSIEHLSELNGQRIALLKGSIQKSVLDQMLKGFGYEVSITETDSYEQAFKLASEGAVDMVITNHFAGDYFYREYGLTKTPLVFNPVSLYFATDSGTNQDLIQAIDHHLQEMKSNSGSVYYKVLSKWMERPPKTIIPHYLIWIIGGIGSFLALAFIIIFLLRKQVRIRTKHLEQINEELRKSEQKFSTLFEKSAFIATLSTVKDNVLVNVNKAFEETLGYSKDESIGKSILELGINPNPNQQEHILSIFKENGTVHDQELILYTKSGEKRFFLINMDMIEIGEQKYILNTAMDITERKQQQKEYKQLIDGMNDTAFVISFEGKFIAVNNRAINKLGYSRDELHNMGPADIDPHLKCEEIDKLIEGMKVEEQQVFETEHRTKDGKIIPVEISSSPVNYQGEKAILSIARDITKRNKLEKELRQSQKMESIGRLAGGIAHDMNNLLSPILGYSQILKQTLSDNSKTGKYINSIYRAGKSAKNLVSQLLTFSRKQPTKIEPIKLNLIINNFKKLLRNTIKEDIKITYDLHNSLPIIDADQSQIEQIIMNLVVNAGDAMPKGGAIKIKTTINQSIKKDGILRQNNKNDEYVTLEISDTGHGIDEEIIENIFDPFFSTKGKSGTGMGLSTVYGIIKQHKGDIQIESSPDQGTTFKIYFPKSKDTNRKKERTEIKATSNLNGSETILIAEDNEEALIVAQEILERFGYSTIMATNGKEALNNLDDMESPPDLLLTDVVMPGMNGKELYKNLSRKYRNMKVIYMSGYTDSVLLKHGLNNKNNNFIRKPLSIDKLAQIVRNVLDQ